MLSRRRFLTLAGAAGATLMTTCPVQAALRTRMERSVFLHNIHTGESFKSAYWHDGRYQPGAMRQLSRVLRDHYSGDIHPMDPHVIDLLSVLQQSIGHHKPFQIVSGYRSPHTNAMLASATDGVAQHSLHMEGKAIDFRIEGTSVRSLGHAAIKLRAGGVGQYPASNFVHVDVGRVRTW